MNIIIYTIASSRRIAKIYNWDAIDITHVNMRPRGRTYYGIVVADLVGNEDYFFVRLSKELREEVMEIIKEKISLAKSEGDSCMIWDEADMIREAKERLNRKK